MCGKLIIIGGRDKYMVDPEEQSDECQDELGAEDRPESETAERAPAEEDKGADEPQPIDEVARELPVMPAVPAMADEEDMVPEQMRELEEAFEADNVEDTADPMAILRGETPESAQYLGFQDMGIPSTILPIPRAARARRYEASRGRAHAIQFKALMAPLLLAVGVLLFVIGVICLIMGRPGSEGDITIPGELFGVEYVTWITILSFPVGAILLLGAWLFRRDVRNAREGER